jgi:hypothetical protein
MKIFLIFYQLSFTGDWTAYSLGEWPDLAACNAHAARWNADQPFVEDNQPYLACEAHYGRAE